VRVEVEVLAVRPNEPSGIGHNLSLICQLTSEDIKQHFTTAVCFDENPFTSQSEKEETRLKGFQILHFSYWSFLNDMAVKGLMMNIYLKE